MWSPALLGAWIAVAISGPAPSGDERAELLRACSEAIAGRCSFSGDVGSAGAPDALAVITLDAGASRARVELGRSGSTWKKRELAFAQADSPKERWRALGLTLATLFGDPAPAEPEPKAPPPRAPAPSPQPALAAQEAREPLARDGVSFPRLGAALSLSPALTQGPLRWGLLVRASAGPFGGIIEPVLGAGYALRPGSSRDLDLSFATLTAGVAVPYRAADILTLRLRLEAAGEWVLVSQSEPADSGQRFVAGAVLGVDASWPARSRIAGFVGADLWMFTGGTAISAGSENLASVPARRIAALAGILLELD